MIDGPFSNHHHVGDGWFYCYETGAWHEPALSDPA
jgi:hypothetical protein